MEIVVHVGRPELNRYQWTRTNIYIYTYHNYLYILCVLFYSVYIYVCVCMCLSLCAPMSINYHVTSSFCESCGHHKAPAGSLDDATAVKVSQKILPRFGGLGLRGSQGPKQEPVLGLLTGKVCCNVSRNAPQLQGAANLRWSAKHQVLAG